MVQFIFTPWRHRAELLRVRSQLFPLGMFDTTTTTTTTATTSNNTAAATTAAMGGRGSDPDGLRWWRTPEERQHVQEAIARVFMWVNRGHCPHVVESTALLMSAILFDERGGHDAVSGAAVRAGYLMGFTRFVTGLLDSHQDKARKLSMYGVAKTIGLPASFVELRHQGTHEPMPSLTQLRPAARRALGWIWEYYWKNLPPEEEKDVYEATIDLDSTRRAEEAIVAAAATSTAVASKKTTARGKGKGKQQAAAAAAAAAATTTTTTMASRNNSLQERMCRAALMGYLQRQDGEVGQTAAKEGLMRQLQQWDHALVIQVLADVGGSARDQGLLLRAVKLSREILGRDPDEALADGEEAWRAELSRAREEVEAGTATASASGSLVLGKRKKDEAREGEDEDEDGRGRTGWFEWKGPWTPRPIGCL